MRKLVSIKMVSDLLPIPGADRIELAVVDGWTCIVKKGEFTRETLCVYFEIDSAIPVSDTRFSFLSDSCKKTYNGKEIYRIKTMKMKGCLSQGLALPLSMFPEITNAKVGDEVTDLLGVEKYDVEVVEMLRNPVKIGSPGGKFPSFIPKTDQERIQNIPLAWTLYKDTIFEETLKLDGSSMTCYKIQKTGYFEKIKKFLGFSKGVKFGVCSRNLELKPSDDFETTFNNGGVFSTYKQSQFWDTAIANGIPDLLPEGFAVQGELIAPNIQGNHEKVHTAEFHIFDVWDIKHQRYLTPSERFSFLLENGMAHLHIPIVNSEVAIFKECKTLQELLKRVEGCSMNPETISEGRVYKSHDGKFSFKCINNAYLLRFE